MNAKLFLKLQTFRFVCLLLLSGTLSVEGYNYCLGEDATELCGNIKHTMCTKNQEVHSKLLTLIPMTNQLRQYIVDMHNHARNWTASGKLDNGEGSNFPKASRLREMRWDDELAFIATHHAKTCKFTHDKCRATKRFPFAGQCIGVFSHVDSINDAFTVIYEAMLNEKNKIAIPEEIVKDLIYDSSYGHFTVLVHEYSTHIGCGISFCSLSSPSFIFICNYSYTNSPGPIYEIAQENEEPASRCDDWKEGKSVKYNQLCANNGKFSQPSFRHDETRTRNLELSKRGMKI